MNENFLNDTVFLNELDNLKIKEQYIKLTVLDWDENPLTEIQGKAISGSLNLNGSSSLRRTANFSMFAEEKENDLTQIDQQLSINRKVKLEIGFKNTIPPRYIEYFLNEEYYKEQGIDRIDGIVAKKEINYQELYGDIVWFPLGIFVIFDPVISHQVGAGVTISITLKDKMCLLNGEVGGKIPAAVTFSEKEDQYGVITNPTLVQIIYEVVHHFGVENPSKIIIEDLDTVIKQVMKYLGTDPAYFVEDGSNGGAYYFSTAALPANANIAYTFEYGDDIGFKLVDFVYPGELTCNPGDTVTSVLDKIISVLGNFEYFYDVYGYFHFQEIKNYLNTTQVTTIEKQNEGNIPYDIDFGGGKSVYTFKGMNLISATTNSPKYSNVRNDFVVWGVRKSSDGNSEIPIRFHLAIDKKPEIGQSHIVNFYTDEYGYTRASAEEFIQIYNSKNQFPETGKEHTVYIIKPQTSLTEMTEFYRWDTNKKQYVKDTDTKEVTTIDWRQELYYQGIEAQNTGSHYPYYFTELINEWPKLFNLKTQNFFDSVREKPSGIDFFLDMIDDDAAVGQYNVQNIGRRSEVVSDDKINCVFEPDVPDIIFINIDNQEEVKRKETYPPNASQAFYQIDNTIDSVLAIGGSSNSCYERIKEMLYQYTHMNESISISAIPIYYLQPNTRITVIDETSGINGDFIINQISLPLDISSVMTINAYKALTKI